ncbi:hypothetical protein CDAR_108921 [Caerostris darwini]|uniref:Secreted protein n=1 Tax=Caerostris darwini TaxID=1538125 RepID=A0AAV4QP18_9ARAC|nr:hypothetical protein CDAR_108921 [Caerostris darwini]
MQKKGKKYRYWVIITSTITSSTANLTCSMEIKNSTQENPISSTFDTTWRTSLLSLMEKSKAAKAKSPLLYRYAKRNKRHCNSMQKFCNVNNKNRCMQ